MKITIGTPFPGTQVEATYCLSLLQGCELLHSYGVEIDLELIPQCTLVQKGRNQILSKFYRSNSDQLIYIDSDIGFQPNDLLRLVQCRHDIVCGLYPYKIDKHSYPFSPLEKPDGTYIEENGFIQIKGAPGGFLKINRVVIENLIKYFPHKKIIPSGSSKEEDTWYNLFECNQIGDEWMGEDTYFSKLCRDIGYDIWAFTDMSFTHTGTKAYEGNYERYVLAMRGVA